MAPSLLQTLLHEPTRRYQSIYTGEAERPVTPSYQSKKHRASSVRSTSSAQSASSSTNGVAGQGVRDAAWQNGKWEWSAFGGRGGLTGGPGSLHAPSVVGRSLGLDREQGQHDSSAARRAASLLSAGEYDDERGSVRSGRSGRSGMSDGSVRTSMSAPGAGESSGRKKKKKASSRTSSSLREEVAPPSSGYDPRPRTQSFGAQPTTSRSAFRSGLSPSMSSASFVRHEGEQTSRRYSSMSGLASASSYPTSPNLSAISSSSSTPSSSAAGGLKPHRSHRSKSPLHHLPSDDATPSLTSSASSAPSSPPATPLQPPFASIPALELADAGGKAKKEKKKKREKRAPVSIEDAVMQVGRIEPPRREVVPMETEEQAPQQIEQDSPPTTSSSSTETATSPTPVAGKFYSVDELFALAGSSSPSPPAESAPLASNPSAAFTSTYVSAPSSPPTVSHPTAAPAPPPLARTESDNASFTTALEGAFPTPGLAATGPLFAVEGAEPVAGPVVPRLRLTRTESDQSRAGERGDVELAMSEGEGTIEEVSEEEEEEEQEPVSLPRVVEEAEASSSSEEEEEDEEEDEPAPVEPVAPAPFPSAPAPAPAPLEAPPAPPEPPQLAHFVQVKRTKSKRKPAGGGSSPSRTYARAVTPIPEPTYQVIRSSSSPSPRSSSRTSLSAAEHDPALRSVSPALSGISSSSSIASDLSSASASTAATDVPDWLKRIRALGEPIQPLQPLAGPSVPKTKTKQPANPPAHWTVQQLRAREASNGSASSSSSGSSSGTGAGGRPPINRPRSHGSLRARAKVMEPMPEDREAEALAVAEEQAARRASKLQVTPAWVKAKDGAVSSGLSPSPSSSLRSPSPNGSSSGSAYTASTTSRTSPHRSRRTRSVDFSAADRDRLLLKPTSPLSRSTSLSSASGGSRTSYTDADLEAIVAAADAKPKTGLAKFLQPPLASSKAIRPAPVVAVTNHSHSRPSSPSLSSSRPGSPSPSVSSSARAVSLHDLVLAAGREEPHHAYSPTVSRASSMRELAPSPQPIRQRASSLREYLRTPQPVPEEQDDREEEEEEGEDSDSDSACGRSELSTMSAPQLSPARPPKNPARQGSTGGAEQAAPPVPSIPLSFANSSPVIPAPASPVVPPMASRSPSIASAAPVMSTTRDSERTPPRPLSRSFSEVERPSMHARKEPPPPVPVMPEFARAASPAPTPSSSSVAPGARPFSSLISSDADVAGPTSLALSPRIDFGKKKTSRRFGLFKRSSSNDLASSSSASGGKHFSASTDLVFEPLDAALLRKRLRNDEVLVEVIAVGVDRWDRERVWAAAKGMGGAGFVGGRAVVGKVVEVGDAVGKLRKGEIVWGLNSVKKSSALASLAVLSRDHVSLAPAATSYTFSQLASLPAPAATAMLIMSSLCAELPKGSKILVLNAHRGVGHLCLQLAAHLRPGAETGRDLWMVAQCPIRVNEGEVLCKEAGATDVLRDEPLAVINGLHEGSFDAVIDTIGGRRLYDASRRILHHSGSFITTVGDSLTPSTSTSSPSSSNENFRSLRRAFFKKDKKAVSYWRVNPDADEREAVRDTLDKVRGAVEAGGLKPLPARVLPFSESRRTFEEREAEEEVVVQVKET